MLRWNWSDKMGKITLYDYLDEEGKKTFNINVYDANCLAVFINEYKDNGKNMYTVFSFWCDEAHAKRIYNSDGSFFGNKIKKIELNIYFPKALKLVKILTKAGYKVTTYYKKPK